jgi:hypothetical protein
MCGQRQFFYGHDQVMEKDNHTRVQKINLRSPPAQTIINRIPGTKSDAISHLTRQLMSVNGVSHLGMHMRL